MTLKELKALVDHCYNASEPNRDLRVVIPNGERGIGSISSTGVKGASQGIDWDHGMFIITPTEPMMNRPSDVDE